MLQTGHQKLSVAEPDNFNRRIAAWHLSPLWEQLGSVQTSEPTSPVVPTLWRYEEIRPFLLEAGRVVSVKQADRRVLVLENPGLAGQLSVTHSLYAGLQIIFPGETAPAHRHTQSALRFVIEGNHAYTAVGGERTTMHPGDFVITPPWQWHSHGNEGNGPMVWLDGLDIPLVRLLDAGFFERLDREEERLSRPEGDSLARYGMGLVPVDYEPSRYACSPVFNYPYARTREALETMRRHAEWDPFHGLKLRFVNPATGESAMPTIQAFMQLLPRGFLTAPYRSTDATVYVPVEGSGKSQVGSETFPWAPHDVFVVPSWARVIHQADEDAVLFSFSDRPVQQKLTLWREDRSKN